jgi:hypothetical protein
MSGNHKVINSKILEAFEAVAAHIHGAAKVSDDLDLGALVAREMQKPSPIDEELDAALQDMPEYRTYRKAPRATPESGFDDFAADAQRWSDVLHAGLALKTKMLHDWLATGCPSKNNISIGAPLKLVSKPKRGSAA